MPLPLSRWVKKGETIGTLLGDENKGMSAMFQMMNEARAFVGMQGLSVASASYMYALDYARNRIQGRHLLSGRDAAANNIAIIEHPDVKRQLLTMKVYNEGMRSLLYYYGKCLDIVHVTDDDRLKSDTRALIEVLSPIVKGFVTDKALDVCSLGIQVSGGYDYVSDYLVEQLMRDARIFIIYEGTNGIQAMDLIGRKLAINNGDSFRYLLSQMKTTVEISKNIGELVGLAEKVRMAVHRLEQLAEAFGRSTRSEKMFNAYGFAHLFLEVAGDIATAWMLLWRASIAAPKLVKKAGSLEKKAVKSKIAKNKDVAYYLGQIESAKFFIKTLLPGALGKMDAIQAGDSCVEDIPYESFGSK